MITVTNRRRSNFKVAINHWGIGGNTTYYTIKPSNSETWDRSDERGFVMFVEGDGAYYVSHNSSIILDEQNQIINTLNNEALVKLN